MSAPKNILNQHFVMVPQWDGSFAAEAIYAASAEAAVADMKALFTAEAKDVDVSKIRLAVGDELPWKDTTEEEAVRENILFGDIQRDEEFDRGWNSY